MAICNATTSSRDEATGSVIHCQCITTAGHENWSRPEPHRCSCAPSGFPMLSGYYMILGAKP